MDASNESGGVIPLSNLPPEIITEILLNLPVKSLLKFRCVCKSWLSLISSSKFIKTHLNYSEKSSIYANHSAILGTNIHPVTYYICSLSSILCDTVMENSRVFYFPGNPHYMLLVVGSCRGLLCVSTDFTTVVLYNPSIRKLKTLPVSGTDMETSDFITWGFCYDELNDDFKVVELNMLRTGAFIFHLEVMVYSLSNDSWRRVENNYAGSNFSRGGGTNVGGILHWFSDEVDDRTIIFAVNTVTYRLDTLAPPQRRDGGAGESEWILGKLDGCLGVFYHHREIRVDAWAMKEYGVEKSWTKLFSIPYPGDPQGPLFSLFVLKNGDIVLNWEQIMMLYNPRNNSFTDHELHTIGGMCYFAGPTYIESLVSPGLVGEQ